MTPIADPDRTAIYAGAPDGRIRKLAIATGKVLWSTSITRDPTHEKLDLLAQLLARARRSPRPTATSATRRPTRGTSSPSAGDRSHRRTSGTRSAPTGTRSSSPRPAPRATRRSGRARRRGRSRRPASCSSRPATRPFDGKTNWGDSVARRSRRTRQRMLEHWTPPNADELERERLDLGSTAPALLGGGYFVQGGKDGLLRCLALTLAGVTRRWRRVQTVPTPGATDLFSEPATWQGTWVYRRDAAAAPTPGACAAGSCTKAWSNGNGGTSPVLAGGPPLRAVERRHPRLRADDGPAGRRAADRRRALAEPDRRRRARDRSRRQRERPPTSGMLDIYRLARPSAAADLRAFSARAPRRRAPAATRSGCAARARSPSGRRATPGGGSAARAPRRGGRAARGAPRAAGR